MRERKLHSILHVVNYEKAAESIGLPQNYEFLRILTKIYIENLKRLLLSGEINSGSNKSDTEISALSSD